MTEEQTPAPRDVEQTFLFKPLFLNTACLLESGPQQASVFISCWFPTPGWNLKSLEIWGNNRLTPPLEWPQAYARGVSLFADFFSLPTCLEIAGLSLYIAREEAGFAVKIAA